MQYQVRYIDTMSDRPMSGCYDDIGAAAARFEELKQEILTTWATPDISGLYLAMIGNHGDIYHIIGGE